MAKRDIFAHGYVRSDSDSVTVLDRSRGGEFKATEHTFTFMEFQNYVATFGRARTQFPNALGCTREELNEFDVRRCLLAIVAENLGSEKPWRNS